MLGFSLLFRPPVLTVRLHPTAVRSPTADPIKDPPAASVADLASMNLRRQEPQLVRYYALFKGWLLLSQPPSCL